MRRLKLPKAYIDFSAYYMHVSHLRQFLRQQIARMLRAPSDHHSSFTNTLAAEKALVHGYFFNVKNVFL